MKMPRVVPCVRWRLARMSGHGRSVCHAHLTPMDDHAENDENLSRTPLWTLDELCTKLRATPRTVHGWRRRGTAPAAYKVGRYLMFDEAEYERLLGNHVVPRLGKLRLYELTPARCQAWIDGIVARGQGKKNDLISTTISARGAFISVLDRAVVHDALRDNPARKTIPPARKPPDPKAMTTTDVYRLRAAVRAWEASRDGQPGPGVRRVCAGQGAHTSSSPVAFSFDARDERRARLRGGTQ
jgi:hypothetical protein